MLKELLGEHWTQEIEDALKDKVAVIGSDPTMIPKSRFDEVIKERNDHKTKVEELMVKIEEVAGTIEENDSLKTQLTQVKGEHEEYILKVEQEKVNSSKKNALKTYLKRTEKVLNPELLLPFYDLEKISFDDNKNLTGVKDTTEMLKTKFSDQFGKVVTQTPDIKTHYKDKTFGEMSLKERTEFKRTDQVGYETARKAHLSSK